MTTGYGILGIGDNQRAFDGVQGQQAVYDEVKLALDEANDTVSKMYACFVEKETENFKFRYLLPGGNELQRVGLKAPAGAVKRSGYYDVAFPLREWALEMAGNRVALGYMSGADLEAQIESVMHGNLKTVRRRILTSIFEDTNLTFTDPIHGSLTVRRLANTDGTLYPPVLGSETEADDDHYIDAGYTVAAIADANNPALTLRDEIAEHFGGIGSAGKNFVYFHGTDQTAYLQAITGWTAVTDKYTAIGDNTAEVMNWPVVPGRLHGRVSGVWLSEWDGWIPDKYGLAVLLGVPAPLIKRNDTTDSGLGKGFRLVATDEEHPFERSSFSHRFGYGCGNRLSAACIMIDGANGGYSPPSTYAE